MSTLKTEMSADGNTLILKIDVSAKAKSEAKPSASGKSKVLATTHGFTRLGDVGVSLNVTIPNE